MIEPPPDAAPRLRLNKYLAENGICSRREADTWLEAGRVTLNGRVAGLGDRAGPADEVSLDGQPLGRRARRHVYIALHKPVGITCTSEPDVYDNIVEFIGHKERIFPIGRLDKPSEGLILLTSDGDIVNDILRVENHHEKEYEVDVDRDLHSDQLQAFADGMYLEDLDATTRPAEVWQRSERGFTIVITEGMNRQIRRMCDAVGLDVRQLVRVRIGNISLEGLPQGHWRNLSRAELAGLLPERFGSPAIA